MKKLMLLAITGLILFSVMILLFFPEPSMPEAGEKRPVVEDNTEEKEKVKANAAYTAPMPSGIHAQWISAKEAKILMDAGNAIVIDVRTQSEYEQGYIEGAKLIPLEDLKGKAPGAFPDPWKMILIYDERGERCERAAKILTDMMYMNVFVFGGIKDWPYDIVKQMQGKE